MIKKTSFQGLLKLALPILVILAMLFPVLPTGIAFATDALQESYTADSGLGSNKIYGTGTANRYAAVGFYAVNTYKITSFEIDTYIVGTPGNVTGYLWPVDVDHHPITASPLATATNVDTAGWPTTEGTRAYKEIVFDAGYVLSSGIEYSVGISAPNGNDTDYVWWCLGVATPTYSSLIWTSSDWYSGGTSDFLFNNYGVIQLPAVATINAVSSITTTSATLNASLTSKGNNTWVNVYFEYGYTTNYLETNPSYTGNTTPGNFTSVPQTIAKGITGLLPGNKVAYRIHLDGDVVNWTGAVNYFWTSGPPSVVSEDNDVDHHGSVTHVFQRKGWYAADRYWIIYCKGTNESPTGGFYWKSSTDGLVWSDPYLFIDGQHGNTSWMTNGGNEADELNTYFDGTYVHGVYVWNRNDVAYGIGAEVWYRRGIPNSDGTITWSAAWSKAMDYNAATVKGYASVVADTNGYPWIDYWESESVSIENNMAYGSPTGAIHRKVIKSSTRDGTFTVASGYPYTLKTYVASRGTGTLVQLPLGDLYWIGCGGSSSPHLAGRHYDSGTATWETEVTIDDTDASGQYRFSVVTRGEVVYIVYTGGDPGDYATWDHINYTKLLDTGWTTPVTIISGLPTSATGYYRPVATVTINQATGDLYVFWIDWTNDHIYYKLCPATTGVWGSAVDFVNESWSGIPKDSLSTTMGSFLEVYGGKIGVYYVQSYSDYTVDVSIHHYFDLKFSYLTVAAGAAVQTSEAAAITSSTATLQGYLINNGGSATQVRFEWGTSIAYGSTTTWQSKTTGESFTAAISGLTTNTYYYFRAVAKWADGTTTYGTGKIFYTGLSLPTVVTNNVVSKTDTGGWLEGTLTSLGGYSSVSVFFEYGLTAGYGSATTLQTMAVTGSFPTFVTGLASNTLYHYKAAVQYNGTNYVYGVDKTFTTMAATNPLVYTGIASAISNAGATLQGTLQSLGSYTPVYVFFQYGTTTSYSSATTEQTQTSVVGYNQALSGLTSETTYHFRAGVRYNVSSYAYGSDGTFTTLTSAPISGEPGIDPPDIMSLVSVKVFKNYLVTGDQLFVVAYKLLYNAGNPVADSSDYFDLRLFDGSISKAKTSVKQWGYKPGSIYLAPGSTVTWKGAYSIQLVANISKWVSPPATITRTITAGDWMGSDLLGLDTWVLSTAESLQSYYSSQLLIYPAGGATKVLNDEGSIIFNTGIPGLSTVRPHLFSAYITYPNLTPEGNAAAQSYEATLKAQRTIRLGPYISNYIDSISTLFGGLVSAEQVGGVFLVLIYLLLALTIGALAGNMLWGLSTSVLVIIPGVYFALISPTFVALMIFISGALFVYEVWWKQASA